MKTISKQNIAETHLPESAEPSDFTFKITKIAVSQICQSMGFESAQQSALETLTNVSILYLKTLAKISVSYSNSSNRTQSNVFDLINALQDLSSEQGFTGASTLHNTNKNCLLSSGIVKDLSDFVDFIDEIPFAKPIPGGNSITPQWNRNSLGLNCRGRRCIPEWLPGFPDERTYKKFENLEKDDKKIREDLGLWENKWGGVVGNESKLTENNDRNHHRHQKKKNEDGDLAKERRRVRFKIGEGNNGGNGIRVYKRNWASKGGKRVFCD